MVEEQRKVKGNTMKSTDFVRLFPNCKGGKPLQRGDLVNLEHVETRKPERRETASKKGPYAQGHLNCEFLPIPRPQSLRF